MFVSIHLKNEMVKKTGQAGLVLPLLYFHQSIHQVDASVNKKKKSEHFKTEKYKFQFFSHITFSYSLPTHFSKFSIGVM